MAIFLLRDPPGTLLLVSPRDGTTALDVGSGGMADGCGQEEMDWWGVDIYTGSLGRRVEVRIELRADPPETATAELQVRNPSPQVGPSSDTRRVGVHEAS